MVDVEAFVVRRRGRGWAVYFNGETGCSSRLPGFRADITPAVCGGFHCVVVRQAA